MDRYENADLSPGSVEDQLSRAAGPALPRPMTGTVGGGVGAGAVGIAGGDTVPVPGVGRGRLGGALVGLLLLGLGLCVCLGAGRLGSSADPLGGLGGTVEASSAGQLDRADIQQDCAIANPQRLQDAACRELLYVDAIQEYWAVALPQAFGLSYRPAPTRYFATATTTACGPARPGVGPFYCPADSHVYVDLSFYDKLRQHGGANAALAQAYVLAHEYGHHVQALLGTADAVRQLQRRDPGRAAQYAALLELQADCYAGVWANHAGQTTDSSGQPVFPAVSTSDLQDALATATAAGQAAVRPHLADQVGESAFTTNATPLRQQWLDRGYQTGDARQCTTFGNQP